MELLFEIIALGWLACLFVDWYMDKCWQNKWKPAKPLSCQKCMGMWFGVFYFFWIFPIFKDYHNIPLLLTYSILTSLAASIEYAVIKKM